MEEKISIQFVGFTSVDDVVCALKNAVGQTVAVETEFNVCIKENELNEKELNEALQGYSFNVCKDENDPYGILTAEGGYIAIYKAGSTWKKNKLEKQLSVLKENDECTLSIHDAELLKEDGYPIDQNIRNKFVRTLGYEKITYGPDELSRFESCGFIETWMFKNIFLNDKERGLYVSCGLDPAMSLLTILIANGYAKNLYDDRLVSFMPDEEAYNNRIYPKYDKETTEYRYAELESLKTLLSENYGIEIDDGYRLLHIVNGAFNYFKEIPSTDENVQEFLGIYEKAYREEYRDTYPETDEKNFFYSIRKKIRVYVVEKGTTTDIPLIACLDGTPSDKWVYNIRVCKNGVVKQAMIERFKQNYENALELIAKDKANRSFIKVYGGKVKRKIKKVFGKTKRLGKRVIIKLMRKKGYSDYMSTEWFVTVRNNFLYDKQTPLKTKLWCYKRGFMPWRIHQYGLTEENFREHLSDRDYMYLHQINNSYKKWIEDKMTFRLVLEPFKQHLPKYYYQIIQRDDKQLLIRLPDCPDGYDTTFDELLRLLRDKGKLALKAASGTHGVGFYKMHYEDGKYYMNNKETSETGVKRIINSFKSFYIVTEYINMHDDIKNIYAGSVNTIRIMMINRDGHHPELMDAYMRIGSKKSGVTDNVAFGGVVCEVDLETGEYGNGLKLVDHVYISIDEHPDTGVPLHGVIPNWEIIKKGIVEISQYMGQLEYLGFDVVCTPEGFVILEVNSHQDLHRLPTYDKRVRDFFFYKLKRKEKRYKIKRSYREL